MSPETIWFAALLAVVAVPLAVAFVPDDIAQLRAWWTEKRQEDRRPCWEPGELPRLTQELVGERNWERYFWTPRQRLKANRRMRAAGFGATLAGRSGRLP